tara:strand:- start:763 stop:888 length:126 start_codon:yes stop_codon:yes gene_type:complete
VNQQMTGKVLQQTKQLNSLGSLRIDLMFAMVLGQLRDCRKD